ncbi:flavoprotein family protein [Leptospira inadai serovar Lyme str. 10]|uniref:Flavoprotein family protein n=2 Tax=Leptospira inadai serovar Lyme TaxID=293084 RepID=V6HYG4_9LEPT|nr:NAD(P)/FAD-dependent oxidoreductase [Leptospira inadai]EQA38054.1 flavoprotein family protein [Leptospira inadai serovar Lyme str. 10]PNV74671.1 aminoacetone oxidase family FAD-binding enzyme [Leptospira inadai serovar Lyme]
MPTLIEAKKIAVIGGGAAGFFGAIQSRLLSDGHCEVTLLEKSPNVLSKVRISGGGRCNVTHACFDPEELAKRYPRGGKELRHAFESFQPKDTIDWFEHRGVRLKTEADGRMFPITDDSGTIVDCLLQEAKRNGVTIRTKVPVLGIYPRENESKNRFLVKWEGGEEEFDKVLLASGSSRKAWDWAKNMGHTIETPAPSLFTFEISDFLIEGLQGLSLPEVEVTLPDFKLKQRGPILITHWGLSGPSVLKLSAWAARELADCEYRTALLVDWIPDRSREEIREILKTLKQKNPSRKPSAHPEFHFASRFWERIWEKVGDKRWSEISSKEMHEVEETLKRSVLQIEGKGAFKEEFVTCGGIRRKEVNFKTMESRLVPGLHFAGEVLDIDGITGGFNFQNAWTTSYLAAKGMVS